MSFPIPGSPASGTVKRPRVAIDEELNIQFNEDINVTIPQSKHHRELMEALLRNIASNNYTNNLLPTNVSEALTKFLCSTKLSADVNYYIGVVKPITDDTQRLKDLSELFKCQFRHTKLSLCNGIKDTPADSFLEKLEGNDMILFRNIRSRPCA